MKAATRLNRSMLAISIVFFALTAFALHSITSYAVLDELDEQLHWRFREVESALVSGALKPDDVSRFGVYGSTEWIELHTWKGPEPALDIVYHNIELPEPGHVDEMLDYRRVTGFVRIGNTPYELSITRSVLEWDEVLSMFHNTALIALVMLLFILSAASAFVFKRLMTPLFSTIDRLASIRSGDDLRITLPPSDIDEFQRLNSTLNTMLRSVETAFEEQKEFLQNASHELQTPLAVLRQQTESLLRDPHISDEALRQVAEIQETIARIGRLNHALLLISRIENRQFLLNEQVDLSTMLSLTCSDIEEVAEMRDIRIEHTIDNHCNATVQGNHDLLQIVMYNLLHNAIKFAPEHSTIYAALSCTPHSLQFSVSNKGSIPVHRRPDLFRRFRKVSSSWSDSPGLGLSIVRDICTLHGYTCELGPDADTQTTFIVHIPFAPLPSP